MNEEKCKCGMFIKNVPTSTNDATNSTTREGSCNVCKNTLAFMKITPGSYRRREREREIPCAFEQSVSDTHKEEKH